MEQLLKAGEVEREAVPEVDSLMCFYLNKPLPFLFYPVIYDNFCLAWYPLILILIPTNFKTKHIA